jgi:2-C-methyl-D-erythritol 2,4-cyclodiphosphate synthase
MASRVGFGYDLHRIVEGRRFMLGGMEVESKGRGLAGHSDADALLHALCDALLGAAGLGDIGQLFPDTDPAFAGADSAAFLKAVLGKVRSTGWELANADITVVAERPKLGPQFPAMRKHLAGLLSCFEDQVNLKAKTNEKMGYLGREEAVAVYCVVCLEK